MGWQEQRTLEGLAYYYNTDSQDITWEKPVELMSRQEVELSKGDWTWVPHPTDLWQAARRVATNSDGSVETVTESGRTIMIPRDRVIEDALTGGRKVTVPLWPLKKSTLVFEEDDLVMLDQLNEAMIITNLRVRYQKDHLYTWVGAARSVLVSVNPYKQLKLYGPEVIDKYRNKPPNTKLDPHVFDIANDAYNSLLFESRNQSILISGESGAGKTVCTKQCLSFLAQVAGSERNVEERVIMANPLLEAFGNAQTIRNNNSSRFGKWIQVYFDPMQRAITSAEILNYLLEKSRLVFQQAGERNYHVFYQLTKDSSARKQFGLSGPETYRYTNMSGTFNAKDIDDVEAFEETNRAMSELGFVQQERNFVLGVAAAILNLGNCEFSTKMEKNNVTGSQLKTEKFAKAAAQLLGVSSSDLVNVLSYRSISVRGVKSIIPLDTEKARASCDSLAMGIYGKLFNWLVDKINLALEGDAKDKKTHYIGILDIFGFEIFENNSFGQLNINYCNEKLQQQFNKTTFKEEEALYKAEEIKFTHVEFIDNQTVLDMIEKSPAGILPMLDDECLIPEGSDVKFMNKVEDRYKGHDKFQTDKHRRLESSYNFEIVHYAGIVKYNADGFILKNRDAMFSDQLDLCNSSSNEFMKELFADGSLTDSRKTNSLKPKAKSKILAQGPKSLSYQFRQQLNDLMESLYSTESRYIRTVKPNGKQIPNDFEAVLVNDQLKYSGVFEAVEIRKIGYPFRLKYKQFVCKYSCINTEARGKKQNKKRVVKYSNSAKRNPQALCKEILSKCRFQFPNLVFGKTMVLYKTDEHRMLTLLREFALNDLIPLMQAAMKGHLAREVRRRCKFLDKELGKALKIGNDIDAIDQALSQVKPTLAAFLDIFPGVYPLKYAAAQRHRNALQKWKELEPVFEKLNKISSPREKDLNDMEKQLNKAREILDIPRTNYQIQLYEDAEEQRNFMEVFLENQKLEEGAQKYSSIGNFGKIKDPKEYSKKVFFGKQKYEDVMLTWQKSALPSSVTVMSDDKEVQKVAKSILDKIKMFSGQKKTKFEPFQHAKEILAISDMGPAYNDEIWVQLLKMATNNPNPEFEQRVWDLIAFMLATLKPSEEFELFVLMKLKQAPNNMGQNYLSAYHETKFNNKFEDNKRKASQSLIGNVQEHGRNRFSNKH